MLFTLTQSKYHFTLQVVLLEVSRVLAREGAPWCECHCDLGQNYHSGCNREGRLSRFVCSCLNACFESFLKFSEMTKNYKLLMYFQKLPCRLLSFNFSIIPNLDFHYSTRFCRFSFPSLGVTDCLLWKNTENGISSLSWQITGLNFLKASCGKNNPSNST